MGNIIGKDWGKAPTSTDSADQHRNLLHIRGFRAAKDNKNGRICADAYGQTWLIEPKSASALVKRADGLAMCLAKPKTKGTPLLQCALTTVSGNDWKRQRPAFLAAAGGGASVQAARHQHAVQKAIETAVELASSRKPLDACEFAFHAAARGIVGAVVGSRTEDMDVEKLEALVISYHDSRRRQRHKDKVVIKGLETALSEFVHSLAQRFKQEGSPKEGDGILKRLVHCEELTMDEAECNAHSCLLAGFETTSLLVACTLLHLASNPKVYDAGREEAYSPSPPKPWSAKAVVFAIMKETLRVNPPVLGQPRIVEAETGVTLKPVRDDQEQEGEDDDNDDEKEGGTQRADDEIVFEKGRALCVDLLAAAHGAFTVEDIGPPGPGRCPTRGSWIWDPLADPSSRPWAAHAAPFGMGPRSCPAGSLSLVIAGEVLSALFKNFSSLRLQRREDIDWPSKLFTAPTLVIKRPVKIIFGDDVAQGLQEISRKI